MRPGFPLLPALVAAALSVMILLELRGRPREGEATTPFPAASLPPTAPSRPAGSDPGQAAQRVATSLARPLFSPSRRPPAASPAMLGAAAPSLPRVAGVVITASGRRAIFATKNGAKPLVVGEGGQVGAFTVQSIRAGQVTVLGPEGERVLKPAFDPDPPAPVRPALPQPALGAAIPSALAIPGPSTPRS